MPGYRNAVFLDGKKLAYPVDGKTLLIFIIVFFFFRCRCLKVTPNFICFLKYVLKAISSHKETHLVNEGQPNYVFLALVPILPTDR